MEYKSFRLKIIVYIFILFIFLAAFVFVILQTNRFYTAAIIFIIIILILISFFRSVDKNNQNLMLFFQSIKHSDFTPHYRSSFQEKSFQELSREFNETVNKFKTQRDNKERNFLYLKRVVQHIGMGVLVYQEGGHVDLVNSYILEILEFRKLGNINQLKQKYPDFFKALQKKSSDEKILFYLKKVDTTIPLSLVFDSFTLHSKEYNIVSIQNIQRELEEKEMDAWQKLIRVLTHEIMNSMTPISSLAETTLEMVSQNKFQKDIQTQDIFKAVQTIEKRSKGLLDFVSNYRKLTGIPKPSVKKVNIKEFMDSFEHLFKKNLKEKGIKFLVITKVPEAYYFLFDSNLIEQVLINLVKNAAEALGQISYPSITIKASLSSQDRLFMTVKDNGPGIKQEVMEKIFIPFFSTKKGNSGIGLNFSRQVMWMHNASLSCQSEAGKGTEFTLSF